MMVMDKTEEWICLRRGERVASGWPKRDAKRGKGTAMVSGSFSLLYQTLVAIWSFQKDALHIRRRRKMRKNSLSDASFKSMA